MLFIIMKQMMLLVSYLFLLLLHLFGFIVFWGCSSGKFVLVPFYLWLHLAGSLFGSYFSSVYCGCIWREFVFVPIFPVTTSLHLAGSLSCSYFPSLYVMWLHLAGFCFWFLFFQQLRHAFGGKFVLVPIFQPLCGRIWWEVCFSSYFSSVYCGRIWREFVFVPIFPTTT